MTSEKIDTQRRTPAQIALHTLGGILIGLLTVMIPFTLASESPLGLQTIHIIAALGFVACCGTVSAIGGDKMLDRIADMASYLQF